MFAFQNHNVGLLAQLKKQAQKNRKSSYKTLCKTIRSSSISILLVIFILLAKWVSSHLNPSYTLFFTHHNSAVLLRQIMTHLQQNSLFQF